MNPIERALSLLLLLSRRKLLSATELSRRFSVSVRTIYRDIDRLIALGVPVEAERGAEGGFRLSNDFLSPPISLNRVETTALLVALSLMRGLRATPLSKNLESAEAKLLAALPQAAREILAKGASIVGIEQAPDDIFHGALPAERIADQHEAVDRFLDGILMHRRVDLVHRGATGEKLHEVEPHGLLFDRSLWYLVGRSLAASEIRMWRADRVASINVTGFAFRPMPDFDIRSMLGRRWLEQAMRTWDKDREGARIRLVAAAAERLRRDWVLPPRRLHAGRRWFRHVPSRCRSAHCAAAVALARHRGRAPLARAAAGGAAGGTRGNGAPARCADGDRRDTRVDRPWSEFALTLVDNLDDDALDQN